jgi:hypothetical protein
MADFVHKTTPELAYFSTSGPKLPEAVANYVRNPDLSAVGTGTGHAFEETTPRRYWKWSAPDWTSGIVIEMTVGEQTAVDDAIAALALANERAEEKAEMLRKGMKSVVLVMMREINILRALHSLADRTESQLRSAIDDEIDLQ